MCLHSASYYMINCVCVSEKDTQGLPIIYHHPLALFEVYYSSSSHTQKYTHHAHSQPSLTQVECVNNLVLHHRKNSMNTDVTTCTYLRLPVFIIYAFSDIHIFLYILFLHMRSERCFKASSTLPGFTCS